MDTSTVLKNKLIERIKNSDNMDILQAVQTMLDNADKSLFTLSNDQRDSIDLGRKDFAQGKTKLHDDVMQETQAWLKRK